MKPIPHVNETIPLLPLLGLLTLGVLGCQTENPSVAAPPLAAVAESNTSAKGTAQLWAENCIRCHNVRSPSFYSDAEWEVAMHHMRIRANLTAEEHKRILEFLKSAN